LTKIPLVYSISNWGAKPTTAPRGDGTEWQLMLLQHFPQWQLMLMQHFPGLN